MTAAENKKNGEREYPNTRARAKKNDESTPNREYPNTRAWAKKNEESTPARVNPNMRLELQTKRSRNKKKDSTMELPNKRARNKKNEESNNKSAQILKKNERARRKKNDESGPIFPLEIIIEILSWLPFKYLPKVLLVCREWRKVIHDHYFLENHMGRSSVAHYWYNIIRTRENLVAGRTPPLMFTYIHGCDGLLIFRSVSTGKYMIWNPAIRRILELPDPHGGSCGLALIFVPAKQNYKIASFYNDKESGRKGCEVLTPGPSMSWRSLAFPNNTSANENKENHNFLVVLTGEAFHFVQITTVGKETNAEIVTIDVGTECFTLNRLPNGVFHDVEEVWKLDWDGKLGLAAIAGHNLQLMELGDYKKQKWCEKKIIPLPFLKDSGFEGTLYPLLNKKGDIWFWSENRTIFAYTIKTGEISVLLQSVDSITLRHQLNIYKPSLVSFEGMKPDKILKKYRPPF